MKIAALAGGVGGAKLAQGLATALAPGELTVIVNTADDFDHFGLRICPDLDTVCYTLAGIANVDTGWGRAEETWNAISALDQLGAPTWFRIGDRDLATHLERTRRLHAGESLGTIVAGFCAAWGIQQQILPMTDDRVRTILSTDEGDLEFQEYFVHRSCRPQVRAVLFSGLETAQPSSGVIEALTMADAIIVCPSNPFVSIAPILALPGVRSAVSSSRSVAISPIVGGAAIKGPAAKMFLEMGFTPSASAVAEYYESIVSALVIDAVDADQAGQIGRLGMQALVCNTVMRTAGDRIQLARDVLDFVRSGWQ